MTEPVGSIHINYEVPSENTRDKWHWRKRHRNTKLAQALIRQAIALDDTQLCDHTKHIRINICAYRVQRCRDIANLIGGAKGLVDAMVRAGVIPDDSDDKVTITYEQHPQSEAYNKRIGTTISWGYDVR